MRRAYLLVYSDLLGSRETIKAWADQSPLVKTWRYDLPHCFYLISDATASELDGDLEGFLGKRGRYLITEIDENRQGRLPADTWYLLRNKFHRKK